ncbi:hypothetical protein [Falsiphaeobacter marinintestinus]|uniref:hypothetical protein n=1 Tax=Falsiphaeobacter marinintestinus TaxID=1492905 RepID=UPI0016461110|nr:hypothetical protein [Phaeobacter marinintestinus]
MERGSSYSHLLLFLALLLLQHAINPVFARLSASTSDTGIARIGDTMVAPLSAASHPALACRISEVHQLQLNCRLSQSRTSAVVLAAISAVVLVATLAVISAGPICSDGLNPKELTKPLARNRASACA